MLANFLEKSKPINFIVYLLMFFCFFFTTIILDFFTEGFTWFKLIEETAFFFLFLIVFFFYNFIVSKNKLTFENSYAFFLFALFFILFISKLLILKPLILFIVYLLFLRKIYSLRSSKKVIEKLFDSGFWLGILFIIEPFSLLFITLIYASIFLRKKVSIHTLVTPIIGFISPLIIYTTYLFWNDNNDEIYQLFFFSDVNSLHIYANNNTFWVFGSILLLTICAIFLKSPKTLSVNNSFKKSWLLLIANAVIAVLFALIVTNKDGSEITFLLVPASIIIANGFEVIEKIIIKNIIAALLLIGTFVTFFLS